MKFSTEAVEKMAEVLTEELGRGGDGRRRDQGDRNEDAGSFGGSGSQSAREVFGEAG